MVSKKRRKVAGAILLCVALLGGGMVGRAAEIDYLEVVDIVSDPAGVHVVPGADQSPSGGSPVVLTEQGAATGAEERWYRVAFFDLDGAEITHETIREGDTVYSPGFVPERAGLVFQYWYDLFTYDQVGTPEPFVFGGLATRNLNLVPYYHYAADTQPDASAIIGGEHMVEDISEQLIFDIMINDAQQGNVSIAEIPSVMRVEDAKVIIAEVLRGDVIHAAPAADTPVSDAPVADAPQSVDTPQAEMVIADLIPGGEMEQTQPATAAPVMTEDQTREIIQNIFEISFENAPETDEGDTGPAVMSKDQVNTLIEDILSEGILALELVPADGTVTDTPAQDDPAEPETGAPESIVADIPARETDVMPIDQANALIDEILTDIVVIPNLTDSAETAGAPETSVIDDATDAAETAAVATSGVEPRLEVAYSYDGELAPGTAITVTANLYNVDPSLRIHYQWENNASGTYQPVPGATGRSHTFLADEYNTACQWRVNITAE